MIIKEINLRNFRNHENLQLIFDNKLTVITGPNGVGKTNIIEAIYFLSLARSFRTNESNVLIKDDCEYALIEGITNKYQLKAIINNSGKIFYCDRTLIRNISDYLGLLQAVVFSPSDLFFLSNPPKARRRVIDSEISKINKDYLLLLNKYNVLLKNRNNLLKSDEIDKDLLLVIDITMADLMKQLYQIRKNYIDGINKIFKNTYYDLTNKAIDIEFQYSSVVKGLSEEEIIKLISQNHTRDILTKRSNFGVHRDDYGISFSNKDAIDFCSQGQVRLLMLVFKLAVAKQVEVATEEEPLLLFDDVFSELDLENQKRLFNVIKLYKQVIITTTHLDQLLMGMEKQLIVLK